MEWKSKQSKLQEKYDKKDVIRVIEVFLLFPEEINGVTKWLQFVKIKQELQHVDGTIYRPFRYKYFNIAWL